jgi:hypothetical protein
MIVDPSTQDAAANYKSYALNFLASMVPCVRVTRQVIASPRKYGCAKASGFSDETGVHQSAAHLISARSPADQAGAAR